MVPSGSNDEFCFLFRIDAILSKKQSCSDQTGVPVRNISGQDITMKYSKWAILVVAFFVVAVFIMYKPSRILIPEINGLECVTQAICIDDITRLEAAEALVSASVFDVENSLGPLKSYPKFVLCSTQACYEKFGFRRAAAHAIGASGIVIGPHGWMPHYVKHEIIHHWQAENIGVIKMHFVDEWLIEGMAYGLSDDPRRELAPPWQAHREKFIQWYSSVDKTNLITAIQSM